MLPGDARLYELDGIIEAQVSWRTHEEIWRRWRKWASAKEGGDALRARIATLRDDVAKRKGALCQEWGAALEHAARKYATLDRAIQTGLPLSLEEFERGIENSQRGVIENSQRGVIESSQRGVIESSQRGVIESSATARG